MCLFFTEERKRELFQWEAVVQIKVSEILRDQLPLPREGVFVHWEEECGLVKFGKCEHEEGKWEEIAGRGSLRIHAEKANVLIKSL